MSLRDTLRKSFTDFCASLRDDATKLPSFFSTYSTITDKIQSRQYSSEDVVAAHSFVSIVSTIATDILQLHNSTQHLIEQSMGDMIRLLENQMSNLTITDSKQSNKTDSGRHPAYIKPSYEWLLTNLHNPYPPKETKQEICRKTKSSLKDVDAWFIDVRKRIGWNRIRKTHFSNKQEKIITAASHVFQPKSSSYSDNMESTMISEVNPNDPYRAEFLAMAKNAKSLYADKYPELALKSFDRFLLPTTYIVEPKHQSDHLNPDSMVQAPNELSDDITLSYPTPKASPPSYSTRLSPGPTIVPETFPQSSRKRRQSSVEACESEIGVDRPAKRHRSDSKQLENSVASDPSSPPSATNVSEETGNHNSPNSSFDGTSLSPTISTIKVLKRKRRLSDGDCQLPSKRPHNALCLPRLQTVSDPFPISKPLPEHNFDEWCQGGPISELSDDIPLPANVEDPLSLSLPLNIDLHQYDTSPHNIGAFLTEISDSDSLKTTESSTLPINDVLSDPVYFGPFDLQFDLIAAPPYHIDFQCDNLDAADHFSTFENPDLLSFVPGHIPNSSALSPGDDCSNLIGSDWASASSHKNPVLGDFNYAVPRRFASPDEQEAKRARAQALREELAQLVAEGL